MSVRRIFVPLALVAALALAACRKSDAPPPVVDVGHAAPGAAAAQPGTPPPTPAPSTQTRDLVIALDVSGSMRAILRGTPSSARTPATTRLEVAKSLAAEIVQRSTNDRIGVVVFARQAFVLAEPTLDYKALLEKLSRVAFNVIDPAGTAVGDAIASGASVLRTSTAASRVVVLVSDADPGTEGLAPAEAARVAAAIGVRLISIQLGDGGDAEVEAGVDLFGAPVIQKHRFDANPALFERIAAEHHGKHLVVTDAASFTRAAQTVVAP